MSKWTVLRDDSKNVVTKVKKVGLVDKKIKNIVSLPVDKLKEESDTLYEKKVAQEESLIAAYDEKKLKSKDLIKQAKNIKKREADKAAKSASKEVLVEA